MHAIAGRKGPSEQIPPTCNNMNQERVRLGPSIRLAPHNSIIILRLWPRRTLSEYNYSSLAYTPPHARPYVEALANHSPLLPPSPSS